MLQRDFSGTGRSQKKKSFFVANVLIYSHLTADCFDYCDEVEIREIKPSIAILIQQVQHIIKVNNKIEKLY